MARMPTKDKSYAREKSPLHGLQSRRKLAGLLFVTKKELKRLSGDDHLYTHFSVKKGEKLRPVDSPRRELKVVKLGLLICCPGSRRLISSSARSRGDPPSTMRNSIVVGGSCTRWT